MNETMKTIYFRRAVRKFAPTPVNKKLLDEIFEAGRQAPSAMNRQPWKFYVVTNPQKIKAISAEIAEAAKDKLHLAEEIAQSTREDFIFHGSPVVIFITAPLDSEWAPMDVGMCAQNMMLAAKSLGLDSCPVGFGRYVEKTKSYSDLKIPPSEKVQLALLIGFGAENPITKPRVKDNVVYLD